MFIIRIIINSAKFHKRFSAFTSFQNMASYEWKHKLLLLFSLAFTFWNQIFLLFKFHVNVLFFYSIVIFVHFTDFTRSIWRLLCYQMPIGNVTVVYGKNNNISKNGKCSVWLLKELNLFFSVNLRTDSCKLYNL